MTIGETPYASWNFLLTKISSVQLSVHLSLSLSQRKSQYRRTWHKLLSADSDGGHPQVIHGCRPGVGV